MRKHWLRWTGICGLMALVASVALALPSQGDGAAHSCIPGMPGPRRFRQGVSHRGPRRERGHRQL